MKRSLALIPFIALVGAGCSSPAGRTATYSAGDEVPQSPYSYSGGPKKTGSSTRGVRTPAPVASAQPAPTYAPAPTYTSPPTYTPPPATAYTPPPATPYTLPPATTYTPPPPPPPTPAPAPTHNPPAAPPAATAPAAFIWARSLAEAQALARAQNKLIFLESGRDACGNCQKLKNQTIPEVNTDLGAMSVGYYDDCDRDRNSQAFGILYRNLPGAASLPLVGWVTPDLRWVHGFSGGRDANRFRQEIQTARATWKQMASADRPQPAADLAALAPPAAPTDTEVAALASTPAEPAATTGATATVEALPASASEPASVRTWARAELARAVTAIASGDVAGARSILAEVRTRSEGTPEAREADKGEVAIWNLRRIQAASPDEAARLRAQARQDLHGTVWSSLFS